MNEQESVKKDNAESLSEVATPVQYSQEEIEAEAHRLESLYETGMGASNDTEGEGDPSEGLESIRESARQFIEEGERLVKDTDEKIISMIAQEGVSFAEAKRIADESGLSTLRIKILTTALAAFTALQVNAAEQGAAHTTLNENDVEREVTSVEEPATMEDFVKKLYGEDAPPEIAEVFKRIRFAQLHDTNELSVMLFETDTGIERANDTIGDETSVDAADKERLDRMVEPDVQGVTAIHTHPLSSWSTASKAGAELDQKQKRGEPLDEDQLRLVKSLTAVSENEFNHQELLVREGKLRALPYWPSHVDVLSSIRINKYLEPKGITARSMVADGSGVWEISIVPNTPYEEALNKIERTNDELESGLSDKVRDADSGTTSVEGLREWLASIRQKYTIAQDAIDTINQELVNCTFDITSPYSIEAADGAEYGDANLAEQEHKARMDFLKRCTEELRSQGIELTHYPWPQEMIVSESNSEMRHKEAQD